MFSFLPFFCCPLIRVVMAGFTAFLVVMVIAPSCIKKLYELKTGQSIRVEVCPGLAELHEKKRFVPTMGGIFLLFSIFISLILWMDFSQIFVWIFCVTIFWLGGMGGYDDYLKLKHKNSKGFGMKKKMAVQILFALLIGCYGMVPGVAEKIHTSIGIAPPTLQEPALRTAEYMARYYIPFYKKPIVQLSGCFVILGIFFTIFVITGSSNAVNLTDGLDGLAAGCIILVAATLALAAYIIDPNFVEIAIVLSATAGACLGFLWFNSYPAQIFMGDTGSLALGGILGVAAVFLRQEFLLALIGGVFVVEAASVIIQVASYKWRNKKRIFLCSPLHHHFEYKGWPETKIVVRFWIIGLLLAVIGIISLGV